MWSTRCWRGVMTRCHAAMQRCCGTTSMRAPAWAGLPSSGHGATRASATCTLTSRVGACCTITMPGDRVQRRDMINCKCCMLGPGPVSHPLCSFMQNWQTRPCYWVDQRESKQSCTVCCAWAACPPDAYIRCAHSWESVFPGARVLRQDPMECLFQFVCSSNNHITRIHGMVERLCRAYGTPLPVVNKAAAADLPEVPGLKLYAVLPCHAWPSHTHPCRMSWSP